MQVLTDSEVIDFVETYIGQLIHKIGHRWYWSRGRTRTYYRAESLRDAVTKAIKEESCKS